jgi:hypothetical protein
MAIPKNAIKVGTRQRRTLSRNEVAPAAYPMLTRRNMPGYLSG